MGAHGEGYTRELAMRTAPAGQIVLTFTNRVRIDFATTWAEHLSRLKMRNWLVGATDQPALRGLRSAAIPSFSMRTNLPETEWDWGSPNFKALGTHKIELIRKTLSWGLELVITDVDALVLSNPFEFMRRHPAAAFLVTSDSLTNTSRGEDLEHPRAAANADLNIGYIMARPSALPLIEAWRQRLAANPRGRWDQAEFTRLARQTTARRAADAPRRLFRSYGGLLGGVLPSALFCGGHHYFVSQMPQRAGVAPHSVHTTFQYGGAPGKRHRLREAMLWSDPPSYYDVDVLTYAPSVPADLVHPPAGMTAARHVALMRHQLRQVRTALALASALRRHLVLPPLICGYDKYWAPLSPDGVIPGGPAWAVPILGCPLDHMLNPAELRPSPVEHVREFSFFANPRTPAHLAASAAQLVMDPARGAGERRRLEAVRSRVLNVTNLGAISDTLWGQRDQEYGPVKSGWLSLKELRTFKDTFGRLQGGWCCAPRREEPRAAGFHILHPDG